MTRPKLELSDTFAYHVRNRSNNKEWFYLPIEQIWHRYVNVLNESCYRYGVELHAFVLMSNHYHMILSTRYGNLSAFMRYFQTETCKQIQRKAVRINHIFGTRYKWTTLKDPIAFSFASKYVFRNPVKAGIAESVTAYPYSSIFPEIRRDRILPLVDRIDNMGKLIPKDFEARLAWLNKPTPKEQDDMVKKALRRYDFRFPSGHDFRKRLKNVMKDYGPIDLSE